jgi:hypothetical protein
MQNYSIGAQKTTTISTFGLSVCVSAVLLHSALGSLFAGAYFPGREVGSRLIPFSELSLSFNLGPQQPPPDDITARLKSAKHKITPCMSFCILLWLRSFRRRKGS